MARKRMRSVSTGQLAAWQCLVLSLLLSNAPHSGNAWVSAPLAKRRSPGWHHSKSLPGHGSRYIPTTALHAGNNALEFVPGFDASSLVNPLANPPSSCDALAAATRLPAAVSSTYLAALESSGGAVDMKISNTVILGVGGLAVVSLLGLAAFFLFSQKEAAEAEEQTNGLGASFGSAVNEVAAPQTTIDPSVLSQQLQNAENVFQSQQLQPPKAAPEPPKAKAPEPPAAAPVQQIKPPEPPAPVVPPAMDSGTSSAGLETLLANEKTLRVQTESKLAVSQAETEALTEQLAEKEKVLVETTEKWNLVKTMLDKANELKETLQSELKAAAESTRILEDKYELEQNTLRKTRTELDATQSTLEATENRLARTQGELSRVHGELLTTKGSLSDAYENLESMEEEQKSLRNLGGKMWRLSKSRVSNRIHSVGGRLRRLGRRKSKK